MSDVCALCGVAVAANRAGRLVHTDEVPKGVEEHDVLATTDQVTWDAMHDTASRIAITAAELAQHHAAFHPASDCVFVARLAEALRSRR